MIHISFVEPTTKKWRDWRKQCEQEQGIHNKAIEAGELSKVKTDVYKGKKYDIKKDVFINPDGPFHGKCAFCEQKIYSNQHVDIEHFRPKGGIKDENNKPIQIDDDGETIDHPGYYWLAYDWRNLLPSCVLCNQPSSDHSEGPIGKRNYFPVKDFRACRPGEEEQEEPLLLHPVFRDPKDHLRVDETGVLVALTKEGRKCIDILALNERNLPKDRRDKYLEVRDKVGALYLELATDKHSNKAVRLKKDIRDIKKGAYEYCAAARKAIEDARADMELGWSDLETKD